VNTNGTIVSADLGNSSNYSNEIQILRSVRYSTHRHAVVKLWRS